MIFIIPYSQLGPRFADLLLYHLALFANRALDSGMKDYRCTMLKGYHAHMLGHNEALDFNLSRGHMALVQSINVLFKS